MSFNAKSFAHQSGALAFPLKALALICMLFAATLLIYPFASNQNANHPVNNQLPDNTPGSRKTNRPDYEKVARLLENSEQNLSSTIVVPIAIDLAFLEERLNEDLPSRLADINETKVCVKAKWLKTKIPYIDGLKIKSRSLKTKLSPEIRCNIKGYIDRRDTLSISGDNDHLLFSLPIHASVTAKAGVRETAVADATFFASASIEIDENWQPHATVDTDFRWDRRPELKLFNLVKVTFGSKIEPALRERLKTFEQKIPRQLSKVNFKSDAQSVWDKIQQPVEISKQPSVYSSFIPDYIGYTGFQITARQLTTQLIIKGRSRIGGRESIPVEPVPLLPLVQTKKSDDSFRLVVPTIIDSDQIQTFLDRELNEPIEIAVNQQGIKGDLTITDIDIKISTAHAITAVASVQFDNRQSWLKRLDIFDWFSFTGIVVLDVSPVIDSENNVLYASDIQLDSNTSSAVANTLADAISLPFVKTKLASVIKYDFSADLKAGIRAANQAINKRRNDELSLSGQLHAISINQLIFTDDALAIIATAEGKLQAQLSREPRIF